MGRVTHFEIHASQPEALIGFYSAVLGWKFTKYAPMEYWLIETGPAEQAGINGGLLPRRGDAPAAVQAVNAYVCTAQVDDLETTVAESLAHGGVIALPKMPIPGVGWLAYVKDPDGNILGLMQNDANAG